MYPDQVSEDAAHSAGHVGNFLSQQYWVACKILELENIIQDCPIDVM